MRDLDQLDSRMFKYQKEKADEGNGEKSTVQEDLSEIDKVEEQQEDEDEDELVLEGGEKEENVEEEDLEEEEEDEEEDNEAEVQYFLIF